MSIYLLQAVELIKKFLSKKDEEIVLKVDEVNRFCGCDGKTYLLTKGPDLIARACVHKFTWYGREIRHLVVSEKYRRQGFAMRMNKELIDIIKEPLVFATVRKDNEPSRIMCAKVGFKTYNTFVSKISKEEVEFLVLQKEDYSSDNNGHPVEETQEHM